ncbi:hypothetical protein [Nonomuraea lactucae]|uniref:hypothetical protein n=1 Tax=Nonomuraea lactucae TaxID=2249762 RepID=UPI000DE4EA77|nr:hypothetical protein [Nonomuraea lactucae]
MEINHDHLRKHAAPAFDDVAAAVRQAVERAGEALGALGGWPADEEVDRAFVEWYGPKRNEMLRLIGQFGQVYEDIADGLVTMQRNVRVIDWGVADDITVEDIPVYTWPDEEAR